MKIPKSMKVGRLRYTIKLVPRVALHCNGRVTTGTRLIQLSTLNARGVSRTLDAVSQTMWHELTHAILHDMGHALHRNEVFVEAFSQRLSKAINSAEF